MKGVHDLFSNGSEIYVRARPQYPKALYANLIEYCDETNEAWDCACGNGQAAINLADYFDHVEATDIGNDQIANSISHPKIRYSVSPAEDTTFRNNQFDLVVVAQALHWFEHDRFWAELVRVLKPGGMFAAWGYSWFKIEPEIDKAIVENFLEIIAPYWAPQNRLLWDQYRDVDIPLRKIDLPSPEMVVTWDLEELFAYLHTWSATRRCMDGIGSEFFYDAFDKLQPLWGDVHLKRKVTMDFCLVASKNDR